MFGRIADYEIAVETGLEHRRDIGPVFGFDSSFLQICLLTLFRGQSVPCTICLDAPVNLLLGDALFFGGDFCLFSFETLSFGLLVSVFCSLLVVLLLLLCRLHSCGLLLFFLLYIRTRNFGTLGKKALPVSLLKIRILQRDVAMREIVVIEAGVPRSNECQSVPLYDLLLLLLILVLLLV